MLFRSDDQKTSLILSVCGILPVVWLALLTAPYVSGGLVAVSYTHLPSQSRQKNSPKENVQVGRDNAVCIFVLLISGKYNRCRLVNVGGERCA